MLYDILTVIYLMMITIIGIFVCWYLFETKKISEKIIGALMLVLILLRLFFIK